MKTRIARLLRDGAIFAVILLGLAEITFRVYDAISPSFIFYDNSYNRFRGKPGGWDWDFRLNSRGFKDTEFKLHKTAGTARLLAIGDSFAYGVVPYRYNYLTLLEQRANGAGRRLEVLNMGIPGIDPQQYLSVLLWEGLAFDPDIVLVSFFIGNDFELPHRPLYSYSYVASFIKFLIDLNHSYVGNTPNGKGTYQDAAPTFTDDRYVAIEAARSEIYDTTKIAKLRKKLTVSATYLEQMHKICSRKKIRFLVVLIPDELQVSPELQRAVIQTLGRDPKRFDFRTPNRLLGARLAEYDIPYLDLLEDFVQHGRHERLYKPNDSHWNIAGNALAAARIGNWLASQLSLRLVTPPRP